MTRIVGLVLAAPLLGFLIEAALGAGSFTFPLRAWGTTLVVAGALLLVSSICIALALRRPRTSRRQWVWRHRRPGAVGWTVRGITVAAALTARRDAARAAS